MKTIEAGPWTPESLLDWLARMGIDCPTSHHPPLRTVADSQRHREVEEGAYTKNLFVRNKKGRMWLLTLLEQRSVDLKRIAKSLGAGNFSFASEERLMRHLGIAPGAVSPLALINDAGKSVTFVLDREILGYDIVHLHPLDNSMTTTLTREDFLDFLAAIDHAPVLFDFQD